MYRNDFIQLLCCWIGITLCVSLLGWVFMGIENKTYFKKHENKLSNFWLYVLNLTLACIFTFLGIGIGDMIEHKRLRPYFGLWHLLLGTSYWLGLCLSAYIIWKLLKLNEKYTKLRRCIFTILSSLLPPLGLFFCIYFLPYPHFLVDWLTSK